jgi:hypothetical protein
MQRISWPAFPLGAAVLAVLLVVEPVAAAPGVWLVSDTKPSPSVRCIISTLSPTVKVVSKVKVWPLKVFGKNNAPTAARRRRH